MGTNILQCRLKTRLKKTIKQWVASKKEKRMENYYIYIMTSESGTLYIGMTNDIKKRVYEHKNRLIPGFTDKYNVDQLLYVETTSDVVSVIR